MIKPNLRPLADQTYFNQEQLACIKASGGTIVSAGAGSGKTSILVEHLLTLIASRFNQDVDVFNKIYVMTFTRKAGHELRFRLSKRIEELKQLALAPPVDDSLHEKWCQIENHLPRMFVGTIDSFYQHALKDQKIWINSFDLSMQKIVDDETLFDRWMEEVNTWSESLPADQVAIFAKYQDWIFNITRQIFFNVALRRSMFEGMGSSKEKSCLAKTWSDEFENFFVNQIKIEFDSIVANSETSTHPWVINWISKWKQVITIEDYLSWAKNIAEDKQRTPSKGVDRDSIKSINDFNKKYLWFINSVIVLGNRKNQINELGHFFDIYLSKLLDFLKFTELTTFSSIQFFVQEAVRNKSYDVLHFSESYFLVDEFQDTSPLQEEVLVGLCQERREQLFCVGDLKQAIYSFRGGDTQLMNHYLVNMPTKINLNINYRSHGKIIDFVNDTFRNHILNFSEQVPRLVEEISGNPIFLHRLQFENWDESNKYVREENEILSIIDIVKKLRLENPLDSICILYRKNATGRRLLFHTLQATEISPEVRLVYYAKEDPCFDWIKLLLWSMEADQWKLSAIKWSQIEKSILLMTRVLSAPNVEINEIRQLIQSFLDNRSMFGIQFAFEQLFLDAGFEFESTASNLLLIKQHISDFETPGELFFKWENLKETPCYLHFDSADKNAKLVFSTIHQSKGLEFDHVIIMGAQEKLTSNAQSRPLISDDICNVRIQLDRADDAPLITPGYQAWLENEKISISAESKRLFYVAVTRAKKSLHFVLNEKESIQDDSWLTMCDLARMEVVNWQHETNLNPNRNSQEISPFLLQSLKSSNVESTIAVRSSFKLWPDLSTTKVASYDLCPKKFYFKYIVNQEEELVINPHAEKSISSAKRGTRFHKLMEKLLDIQSDETQWSYMIEEAGFLTEMGPILNVVRSVKTSATELYLEQELKFFFGPVVVNGTPDLFYFHDCGRTLVVVDFKTGLLTSESIVVYQNQVKLYASAIIQKFKNRPIDIIVTKIMAIDINEIIESSYTLQEIQAWASEQSANFGYFSTKNLNHCLNCGYQKICL